VSVERLPRTGGHQQAAGHGDIAPYARDRRADLDDRSRPQTDRDAPLGRTPVHVHGRGCSGDGDRHGSVDRDLDSEADAVEGGLQHRVLLVVADQAIGQARGWCIERAGTRHAEVRGPIPSVVLDGGQSAGPDNGEGCASAAGFGHPRQQCGVRLVDDRHEAHPRPGHEQRGWVVGGIEEPDAGVPDDLPAAG
jgi:hypothetical protein